MSKNILKNKRAMNTAAAAVLICLIMVGGLGAFGYVYFTQIAPPNQNTTPNPNPSATNPPLNMAVVQAAMSTSGQSSLLGVNTAYTEDGGYIIQWFSPTLGKSLNPSGSNGTGTISIPKSDNGVVWAVVQPASGYYVDASKIAASNSPFLGTGIYGPVLGDGVNYWYFPYNTNFAMPQYGNTAPSYPLYAFFKPYEAITLTDGNTHNITSIGTAQVTKYVDWYATFGSVNHANAITKIVLTLNTTDQNKVRIDNMVVPWQQFTISGSQFVAGPSIVASSLGSVDYTWVITNSLQGAQFVSYTTNTQNKLSFTTQVSCNLASSDVIRATLTVYSLGADGKTIYSTAQNVDLQE